MSAPDHFAARVMQSYLRCHQPGQLLWDDALITAILLDMRVGTFKEGNLNIFQRYTFDVFRCHVCNHVLPMGARAPDTTKHLHLHRMQVKQALKPEARFTDDWEHTDHEPTEEEVRQEDERITNAEQAARSGFYQEVRR